ncbi:MAG: flap endonuclease [Chloroflexi bacterium]|nr:flap endonuclease [Chloroflexota bacterium]
MNVHLIDGTYELFRQFFGAPSSKAPDGREVGATIAWLRSLSALLHQEGTTHVACAYDTVIESFRNKMFDGYKTGEGIDPELWGQSELVERATAALGVTVWSMIEFEADDALATGAARWKDNTGVERILLCTPDKDLAQAVVGDKVVMFDRRHRQIIDEAGVIEKFGVPPASIPDYLALVGDAADGIPGVPRWGSKSAAALLAHYGRVDAIPANDIEWQVRVRGASALAKSLREHQEEVMLYRRLTTLRKDVPLEETLDQLAWKGANRQQLTELCAELGDDETPTRISRWQ